MQKYHGTLAGKRMLWPATAYPTGPAGLWPADDSAGKNGVEGGGAGSRFAEDASRPESGGL